VFTFFDSPFYLNFSEFFLFNSHYLVKNYYLCAAFREKAPQFNACLVANVPSFRQFFLTRVE